MSRQSLTIKRIFIVIGLISTVDLNGGELHGSHCDTGEWGCLSFDHGLRCIPLNKFCDGVKNCPDGSDEPPGCTNCNRTYTGKAAVKFPLRVTGPFQRYLPFVCKINFVATGGEYGDSVELSFLSFQIGRYEFTREYASPCKKGFMKIYEPHSNFVDDFNEPPNFGSFCGRLTEKSATYYSRSGNVTLLIVVPSRASIPSTSAFTLFLTFRFLQRHRFQKTSDSDFNPTQLGNHVPGTFCDRMFLNCQFRRCKIRSPNFPGFYPRNVTCNYHIKQMLVPHSSVASIALHQANDYKIFVPRGGESPRTSTRSNLRSSSMLSTDCTGQLSDSVRIYDGPTTEMPLLAQFCGDGAMPLVTSSGPELLVQLYSAPSSVMCSSRLEIDVSVRFEPESVTTMQKDRSRCTYIIDANRHKRWGVITSPKYTMPENSSCTYKFIGASSYDRVWIYFISYLSREKDVTLNKDTDDTPCTYSKLEIFDSGDKWPVVDFGEGFDEYPMQFCGETNIPKICAHAADYPPNYSPGRPCKLPEESYLSSGPTFILKHSFLSTLDVVDVFTYSNFAVRYEFVDTRQDGIAIGRTECDRRFDSRSAKGGFISNPKNVFLYGRGGRENISCAFHFVGLPSERVRITIFSLRLALPSSDIHCDSHFDNVTQRHVCSTYPENQVGRLACVKGIEYWDSQSATIGCVCNKTSVDKSTKYIFDSLVNNVKLFFVVNFMTAFEDFKDFNFEAKFEFFNSSLCDTHMFDRSTGTSPEGTIEFHVPHGRTNFSSGEDTSKPLRCRWQIKALTEKYLYLQFSGADYPPDNCKDGVWILVYLDTHQTKPTSSACVLPENNQKSVSTKDYHVFSQSWYNDTLSLTDNYRDNMFIEIVAMSSWKGIKIHFHWMEVTKPFYRSMSGRPLRNVDCIFECPEIGACIDPHLWCDGVDHCPSGFDESPANCHTLAKGLEYLSLIITTGAVFLLICGLLITWAMVRHRYHHHSCDPEDNRRTKDYEHHLTPTDDYQMESPVS